MREKFDRYIANLEEASRLVKLRVTPGASDKEILAQVHNGAERLRQLCLEDNALLEEMVFSKKPELLTPAEADALYEAADKLFCFSKAWMWGALYAFTACCMPMPSCTKIGI